VQNIDEMASVKLFLFEGKELSNGEHPVMLRVIKNRKIKYVALGYSCTKKQWNKDTQEFRKNYPDYAKRNAILSQQKNKAHKIIDNYRRDNIDFSLNQFAEKFRGNQIALEKNLYQFTAEKLEILKTSNKVGNYKVYNETLKSFLKFARNKSITFNEINLTLLEKYEAYLRSNGGTDGGISVKMRTLRALYNDAIKKGHARQENYPFKQYNISKLKGAGIKKALTRGEVRSIENLPLEQYPHLTDARHYFVFSYFTRGMNFVDMLHLKWTDIYDNRITYTRAKTGKPFTIKILPPVQDILDYYKDRIPDSPYVFPILTKTGLKANQIANRKKKILQAFNKQLKEIGEILGFEKKLTSYVARHSFATNLKHAGVSTAVISESLGHATQEVTETYLKSFENEIIDEAAEKLL